VQQSIEHGGGNGSVAEDLTPDPYSAVGGDYDAGLQIAVGDNLKQRRSGFGGQW